MYLAAKFFFPGDEFNFGFPAYQVIRIMGYPDRLYGVFGYFAEEVPFGKVGQFAKQGRNFPIFQGWNEFDGMRQVGGIDVTPSAVLDQKAVTVKAGLGIGAFKMAGQTDQMLGGKGCEGKRAMNPRTPRLDGMPMDGEADKFGKEEALFQPVFHGGHDFRRAEDVEGRAPGAQPKGLDERGDLAVMVAVHVADPENLRNVGFDFFGQQKPGGGGAAIEEQADFPGLDENPGMFAPRAGVPVRRAEENGAHEVDVAKWA